MITFEIPGIRRNALPAYPESRAVWVEVSTMARPTIAAYWYLAKFVRYLPREVLGGGSYSAALVSDLIIPGVVGCAHWAILIRWTFLEPLEAAGTLGAFCTTLGSCRPHSLLALSSPAEKKSRPFQAGFQPSQLEREPTGRRSWSGAPAGAQGRSPGTPLQGLSWPARCCATRRC